jgi:peptidoglycan/LPS O-acetylase OafA/YrhL
MSRATGSGSRLAARIRRDLWERPEGHLAPLDGMRGIAPVLVMLWHCALFTGVFSGEAASEGGSWGLRLLTNGGWSGVDVFFVLSGFLIGRILVTSLARKGALEYPSFMGRRVRRIFPAYYLVLTLSLFAVAPFMPGLFPALYGTDDWSVLLRGAWASYAYVSNYVEAGPGPSLLDWGWSLCIEEHFYLLLPPTLWLLFRVRNLRLRFALLVLVAALPLLVRWVQYQTDPTVRLLDGFYYYSHNRFDELGVGVVIAYLYVLHRDRLRRIVQRFAAVVGPLGLACVASVWVLGGLFREGFFPVVLQFLVMALGAGLVLVNGLFLDNQLTRFLAHPAWYPLARVSYGLYLVHPFVLFALLGLRLEAGLAGSHDPVSFAALVLGTFAGSFLVASVMFVCWERPFLGRRSRRPGKGSAGDAPAVA